MENSEAKPRKGPFVSLPSKTVTVIFKTHLWNG